MPLHNMFVLLLGLILVISGFYVAWNAPESTAPPTTIPAFVISVDSFDCEAGIVTLRGGGQTSDIEVIDADGIVLDSTDGVVRIPDWERRRALTVSYLWAGDPGSQVIDPANHCPVG